MTRPIPPELAPGEQPFDLDTLDEAIALNTSTDYVPGLMTPPDLVEANDRTAPVSRWLVTDDGAAEWALRMLAAIQSEQTAILDQFELWMEPIRAWRDHELERLQPRAGFFEDHLKRYAIAVRAEDPKRATISLPSGKISTRAAKAATVEVEDEEAVLKWASGALTDEEYEQVVRVTSKVLISEIRARVSVDAVERTEQAGPDDATLAWVDHRVVWKATGEVVPGLAAYLSETTATVKPAL